MAIDHCTLVTRSQGHSQCSSHIVHGELLPKIEDDIAPRHVCYHVEFGRRWSNGTMWNDPLENGKVASRHLGSLDVIGTDMAL